MTPEIWTISGVRLGLAGLGTGGITLFWRYIGAVEKRSEDRSAASEERAEERWVGAKSKRAEARFTELRAHLKANIQRLIDRTERDHADPRHAIDGSLEQDNSERAIPHDAARS